MSLGFSCVTSLQHSLVAHTNYRSTWSPKRHRIYPPKTTCFYLYATPSTHASSAQSHVHFSESSFPLPCGLWAPCEPCHQGAAILGICLDTCSGFYSCCKHYTLLAHGYMLASAAVLTRLTICALCSDVLNLTFHHHSQQIW